MHYVNKLSSLYIPQETRINRLNLKKKLKYCYISTQGFLKRDLNHPNKKVWMPDSVAVL